MIACRPQAVYFQNLTLQLNGREELHTPAPDDLRGEERLTHFQARQILRAHTRRNFHLMEVAGIWKRKWGRWSQ